jgi:alcohol dehydrogenase
MKAVHLEGGRITLRSQPAPRLPEGFARIRLLLAGICNTDLELQRGYYGFSGTPGHEFVGVVEEVNDPASRHWRGKRVVGEINLACRHCEWCTRGLGRHCPRRTVLGIVKHPGAFRELLTLPVANLREVPRGIPDETAVFTEPLAAAGEILDQVRITSETTIAIVGDGKLGLLIAQVLRQKTPYITLHGRHRDKLRIAAAADIQTVLNETPREDRYNVVVDATGSAEGLRQAVRMTEPRGTLIMKSTVHGLVSIDTAPVIVNEITLVGSRCGRFEPALSLLRRNKVNVAALISDEFSLAEASRAFARAAERGVLKVLLRP